MGEFWGLDGVNGFAAFNFSIYIAIRYLYRFFFKYVNVAVRKLGRRESVCEVRVKVLT